MNKTVGIIIAIVVLLGVVYVGYKAIHHFTKAPVETMQKTSPTPSAAMASPSGSMNEATGSAMNGSVKAVIVSGSNFKFEPSTITVKKGDKVKLTFTNSGGMHDFVIDELNVKIPVIASGKSETVEFTADKAGTYKYYCSVANHRAIGMEGTLTVE